MKNEEMIKWLRSIWPADFALQPKTVNERFNVISIQHMKNQVADEIIRLYGLIDDHNAYCPINNRIDY